MRWSLLLPILLLGVVVQSTGPGTGLLGSNTDKDPSVNASRDTPSTGLNVLAAASGSPDEELAPDDAEASIPSQSIIPKPGGVTCNDSSSCLVEPCEQWVDETPATPDANYLAPLNDSDGIYFDFPTPASNPSTALLAQAIEVTWSRCDDVCDKDAGGTDPNFDLRFFCGVNLKTTFVTAVPVTGQQQNATYNFTYPLGDSDCPADGSNMRASVLMNSGGSGASKRRPCLDAIEWEVTY